MKDYEILKQIELLQPGNLFLSYIIDRIQDDNYRGIQCSQHNRLTYEYFKSLLQTIYECSHGEIFGIHVGDDNGVRQSQASVYYEIVDAIKRKVGKGTINSVKKNTFPDLARAGLLDRFDKNRERIIESFSVGEDKSLQKRQSVYFVKLSSLGLRFVQAQNEFERRKYFTDMVDVLTKSAASDIVELLSTDERFDSLNILEFMYILSDDRAEYQYNNKLMLLTEYRCLSDSQKEKLNKLLQIYCNPNKIVKNKISARDYSNWKNESQQIFGLLANSTYFKVINDSLILNNGEYGLFMQTAKRSQKAKDEYFRYHNIKKRSNYELHHIIPFKKAVSQLDAQYIDDQRNLIYLSTEKHLEFSSTQNINIRASYSNPILSFLPYDSIEGIINVDLDHDDALVAKNKVEEMISYNKLLLQKFYQANQITNFGIINIYDKSSGIISK